MIKDFAVSVPNTSPALIIRGTYGGAHFRLTNNGAATLYLGSQTVSTVTGTPVAAGASVEISMDLTDGLYGLAASGSLDIRILQFGAKA